MSSSSTIVKAQQHTGRDALRRYAEIDSPSTGIPHRVYLAHNETCTAIHDLYPKARYHFVLLPRARFAIPNSARTTAPGAANVYVPTAKFDNLRTLAEYEHVLPVLRQLQALAKEVKELIREDMLAIHGRTWPVQIGFHANESMPHVHCHVLSQDFLGAYMKKPKHWNTFHPHLGFFLHLDQCIKWAEAKQLAKKLPSHESANKLVKQDLHCHRDSCRQRLANMDALRKHLQDHFDRDAANPSLKEEETAEPMQVDESAKDGEKDDDDDETDYDSGKTESD